MLSLEVIAFLAGVWFVAYFFLGYPLLLLLWARWRPRPVRRAPGHFSVSVIIPVRNGECWLRQKLDSVFALDYPRELMEVIVASDGSTDRSVEIARDVPGVKVLARGKSRRLGGGYRKETGIGPGLYTIPAKMRVPLRRNRESVVKVVCRTSTPVLNEKSLPMLLPAMIPPL